MGAVIEPERYARHTSKSEINLMFARAYKRHLDEGVSEFRQEHPCVLVAAWLPDRKTIRCIEANGSEDIIMTVQFDEASRRWRVVDHDGTVHEEFETCAARGSGVTITVRLKPLGVPRRLRCARHFSDAEGQVWIMIVIVIVGVALLA